MEKEDLCQNAPSGPITPDDQSIIIDGQKYIYSINKSETNENSLIIKLYDKDGKSEIFFTYEAQIDKLTKDIKFLSLCESLDEMIESLKEIFSQRKVKVILIEGEYNLELEINGIIKKKCIVQLTKHKIENHHELNCTIDDKIISLENKYKDLLNKYEQLKLTKDNIIKKDDIKNIIKEIILDKDIKLFLLEEIEQKIVSKYNLNNVSTVKSEIFENNITTKIENIVNNKTVQLNNQIVNIEKQLKENINYLNNINTNCNHNYIILQVKIDKNNRNKNIRLFRQAKTYNFNCNFERDDIEVIIDEQMVPINYKNINGDFEYDKESKNCEKSQYIAHNLNKCYEFYWNFSTLGIHTIKIKFKKKLLISSQLFSNCNIIYKIDCSNFDCSQIIDSSKMFDGCSSVVEINLGKLNFGLSNNFESMFSNCNNLQKLDVSFLNTENSTSFTKMFYKCFKLKEINVSKFKTLKCKDISNMFGECLKLESIDMFKWDMSNINDIDALFFNCSNLKIIKMNFNNNNPSCFQDKGWIFGRHNPVEKAFKGLPDGGSFIWKKGINCNNLLKYIPVSWNRTQED